MQKHVPWLASALLVIAVAATAAAQNPGNPCGGKKQHTPGVMHADAVNPCHAKMGTVFYVADPMNRNMASFESDAPLEDIVGTSNTMHGYIVFDPAKPDAGVRGTIMVPVASLDTGIPLRNEHVQSAMWLNAAEHPCITMQITGATAIEKVKSSDAFATYSMLVDGDFSVNGTTKPIKVPATVTYMKESAQTKQQHAGDLLAGRTNFEVKLTDHAVQGAKGVVGSKVSEIIQIKVRFTASTEAPMAMNPCDGKE
jgi:polyisoprenoid-binding protein YceI